MDLRDSISDRSEALKQYELAFEDLYEEVSRHQDDSACVPEFSNLEPVTLGRRLVLPSGRPAPIKVLISLNEWYKIESWIVNSIDFLGIPDIEAFILRAASRVVREE